MNIDMGACNERQRSVWSITIPASECVKTIRDTAGVRFDAIIGEASDANVEQIARGRVWVRIASDRVGSRRIGAMLRQAWEDKRKDRRRG